MEEEKPERFIYVIAADITGPVKIGVSNEPTKRLKQLQTGHDRPLVLHSVESCRAHHALALEQLIHRQLSYRQVRGEWFDLSVEDAIAEVRFGVIRWEDDPKLDKVAKRKRRLTKR